MSKLIAKDGEIKAKLSEGELSRIGLWEKVGADGRVSVKGPREVARVLRFFGAGELALAGESLISAGHREGWPSRSRELGLWLDYTVLSLYPEKDLIGSGVDERHVQRMKTHDSTLRTTHPNTATLERALGEVERRLVVSVEDNSPKQPDPNKKLITGTFFQEALPESLKMELERLRRQRDAQSNNRPR